MKNDEIMTSGKTEGMEEAASGKSATKVNNSFNIVELIVRLLISVGVSFKKVGGEFVRPEEMKRFISTLFALSSVGPYDTTLTVGGVAYPLDMFMVDTRVGQAFVQPRAIVMPGTSPFRKDVSVHPHVSGVMTPPELVEFQHKWFAMYKLTPTLQSVAEYIKVANIGDYVDLRKGDMCHIDDLASVKSVPAEIDVASELYEDFYFNLNTADVIRMVVVNFYTALK
jgi:hypothetical protein